MAWPIVFGTLAEGKHPAAYIDQDFNYLSGPSGSSVVGFLQAGSGAAALLLQDVLRNLYVEPESFGAVAYATKAAANAGVDSTAAINLALATGKNVRFRKGVYSSTGGHTQSTIGQMVTGNGMPDPAFGSGTLLTKRSGTADLWTINQTNQYLADIGLDCNGFAGEALVPYGLKYGVIERILLAGVITPSFALDVGPVAGGTVNLCVIRSVWFSNCWKEIKLDDVLYTDFYDIHGGTPTGGVAIDCGTTQAARVGFHGMYHEGQIYLHGTSSNISFDGLASEATEGLTAAIKIDGANVHGVFIDDLRILRAASTNPIMTVKNAKNVVVRNFNIRDTGSIAGQKMITLDGVFGFRIDDGLIYSNNAFKLIDCTGLVATTGISSDNVRYHSGGAGTNVLKGIDSKIANSNLLQTFLAGGEGYDLANVSGAITRTNAVRLTTRDCNDPAPNLVFTDGDTTPSVAMGAPGGELFCAFANSGATLVTFFDDGSAAETIYVYGDGNTTLDFSASNMKGNNGVDFLIPAGQMVVGKYDGTLWHFTV